MLLRFFKSNQQANIILMPVLFLALWLPSLIKPDLIQFRFDQYPAPLYSIIKPVFDNYPFLGVLITFILLISTSLLLIRLNILFFFINTRTQLPALLYLLITSSYIPLQQGNPAIIAALFLVFALFRIFDSFKKEGLAYNYFDAALLLSFGSLFYFNLIFLLPLTWVALIVLRQPRWREWAFTVIGAVLPYIFLFSYNYLRGHSFDLVISNFGNLLIHTNTLKFSHPFIIFMGFVVILVIVASLHMVRIFASKKIHSRKYFVLFLAIFINLLLLYFIIPGAGIELIFMTAIPATYLISHYYINIKTGFWSEISFIFLIFMVIYIRATA